MFRTGWLPEDNATSDQQIMTCTVFSAHHRYAIDIIQSFFRTLEKIEKTVVSLRITLVVAKFATYFNFVFV